MARVLIAGSKPGRLALAAMFIVALVATACGSSSGSSSDFERVQDTGATFASDQLAATGFRQSKDYNLEGLPGASKAVFGFWSESGRDPLDFEVRFYDSHSAAVELGTAPAEEGTGDDAVLDESTATFKAGVKERRTIIGAGGGGGARSGIGPKYAGFVIYNNLVILCPGGQVEQSHERCADLIDALEAS